MLGLRLDAASIPIQERTIAFAALALLLLASPGLQAAEVGDAKRGRALFRACAACHALVSGQHMTGPSLNKIWGKKAGAIKGFTRYSDALKQVGISWDEHSLDEYLKDPKAFIPKTRMTFKGMEDRGQRRDLITFLRQVSEGRVAASGGGSGASRRGMMGGGQKLNLKELGANNRIRSIHHCGDTYTVIAEEGEPYKFWEFNLRFKTDSSDLGPVAKHPVIISASMRGDRAFVIFASPDEISPFIKKKC